MSRHEYNCPEHGLFSVDFRLQQLEGGVPPMWRCPVDIAEDDVGGVFCDERSRHVRESEGLRIEKEAK